MSARIAIRLADSSMCGRLSALHGASFEDPWDAESFARLLAAAGTRALIALEAGAGADLDRASGFILLRIAADEAEILTLSVLPARRRAGIARKLVESAVQYAAAAGARALFLEVAVDNAPARGLYAALGFEQVGLRRGYYERKDAPAGDALLLRLNLRAS